MLENPPGLYDPDWWDLRDELPQPGPEGEEGPIRMLCRRSGWEGTAEPTERSTQILWDARMGELYHARAISSRLVISKRRWELNTLDGSCEMGSTPFVSELVGRRDHGSVLRTLR